jgi:hypothetical protein
MAAAAASFRSVTAHAPSVVGAAQLAVIATFMVSRTVPATSGVRSQRRNHHAEAHPSAARARRATLTSRLVRNPTSARARPVVCARSTVRSTAAAAPFDPAGNLFRIQGLG